MFHQIERSYHLPEKVADEIGKKIGQGDLVRGERLPAELTLAKTFGVSRSVVREAIAKLRNEGLVETRHGVGAFVISNTKRPKMKLDISFAPDPKDLVALFQLRFALEVQAARLAAAQRSDEQLNSLKETVLKMKSVDQWLASGIEADISFHLAIAEATRNAFYLDILSALLIHMGNVIPVAFCCTEDNNVAMTTFSEHYAVYEMIVAQDEDGAERKMAQHISNSASRLGVHESLLHARR